jgi:enamine deaminase RidA (YjgF/YER057c/UK114 family)
MEGWNAGRRWVDMAFETEGILHMSKVEDRIKEAGFVLPSPAASLANYMPVSQSGELLFVSGQLPMKDGKPAFVGVVGREVGVEDGKRAAECCVLNILGQLKVTVGDLDNLRCLRLGGFVQSAADFTHHAVVLNGASDLLVRVMGDNGRHARAAVGCSSLPLGAAVEVEGTFALISP